jgi:hypothetical protein
MERRLCHETCYHCNPLIVFIAVEEFLAEGKETLGGYDIVFEHYALVGLRECPTLRHIARGVAAVVLLLIESVNVTLPVDILILNQFTAFRDALHVIGVWAWAVLIEKKTGRPSFLDLSPHLAEVICSGMKEH